MIIQWYPGHIAKAEKALLEQLKHVDVVFEVRDARIPLATAHPRLDKWLDGGRTARVLVLNRVDTIAAVERTAWEEWFRDRGDRPYFTDAREGKGVKAIGKAAQTAAAWVNERRKQRGMRPRPVRAAVIGYPNVGKSALINRLLNRRIVESAAKPGVTRQLRWVRISQELELLDAPGILPMDLTDQAAAVKLAICDDIGQASYDNQQVAAALVELLTRLDGGVSLRDRYGVDPVPFTGEDYLPALAAERFKGDVERSARTLLQEFRRGSLGAIALERPPILPVTAEKSLESVEPEPEPASPESVELIEPEPEPVMSPEVP
ncbi:MAG: ribosome biogenesis GTPase YlqF [Cyanobacteria bacterium]|nr:ribosome biogenesis GTPase YlqF [Cyanobacteriota bacterium]